MSRMGGPDSTMVQFHVRNNDLEAIKKRSLKLMAKFNTLLVEYSDWFKRQEQSFIDALKAIQVMFPSLVPQHLTNFHNFRLLHSMGEQQVQNRHPIPGGFDKLEKFINYWYKFCMLKEELETSLMPEINAYVDSVTRMREPEKKAEIDTLFTGLMSQHSETFDFRNIHDAKSNLFTYRLSLCDQNFLGLVGYIPHLTGYCTRICYLVTKLYLEKE